MPVSKLKIKRKDNLLMSYQVKTKEFQGPLDLLLELIEKEKLDITRFCLAQVTDQYLDFVKNQKNISLDNLSNFLLVAAQLILIKSKALLPNLEISKEEEEEMTDLQERLLEYNRFKKAGQRINANYEKRKLYARLNLSFYNESIFTFPKEINLKQLQQDWEKILKDIPEKEKLKKENLQVIISLEDKIEELKKSLNQRLKISFHKLVSNKRNKAEIVVAFLAILEMIKQKLITVKQKDLFQDIEIKMRDKN